MQLTRSTGWWRRT